MKFGGMITEVKNASNDVFCSSVNVTVFEFQPKGFLTSEFCLKIDSNIDFEVLILNIVVVL